MRKFTYQPKGVCSMQICFELDDQNIIHNIKFLGGCPGNTVGVAALAEGQPAAEVIEKLRGIDCRGRGTSCPDQFAQALSEALRAQC